MNDTNPRASRRKRKRPGVSTLYVDIPDDLKDELNRIALKKGQTLRVIVERALQKIVK